MKTYKIPVSWEVYGSLEIQANSLDEAIMIAEDSCLPLNGEYIEGSFCIDHEVISEHNQP
jgi:hypothetical protein